MKQKVAVGLSGGVDSSVSAALLIEQGYDVTGVYLTCWEGPGCRSEEDRQDALDIALQLGIPFEHLDFREAYREKVYEYMIREYEAGRTPNPDVVCNREIKFGLFYEWAIAQGFDYVATGHYARIERAQGMRHEARGEYELLRSIDEKKDQTYFLHQLREDQLQHVLFPIGQMTKQQVRAEAEDRGLMTATKPDSTGVCFIGEVPMRRFLEERITPDPGRIMLGSVEVGRHRGVWFYTIGQRIAVQHAAQLRQLSFDPAKLPHFYVLEKDMEHNVVYVGTEEQLDRNEIVVGAMHWIDGVTRRLDEETTSNSDLFLRIRHTGELIPITKLVPRASSLVASLAKSVRGVAPGQAAVVYSGEVCLGGGVIEGL